MIPHISGLFTQWQVHMVCFSETHPDPTSQIYSYAFLFCPPTPTPTPPLPRRSGWGLSGIGGAAVRCQGQLWSCSEHDKSPARQNGMRSLCDVFVYLCFCGQWRGSSRGEISFDFPHSTFQSVALRRGRACRRDATRKSEEAFQIKEPISRELTRGSTSERIKHEWPARFLSISCFMHTWWRRWVQEYLDVLD